MCFVCLFHKTIITSNIKKKRKMWILRSFLNTNFLWKWHDWRRLADKSSIKQNSIACHQTVQRSIGAQCYYFKLFLNIHFSWKWHLMADPPGSWIVLPVIRARSALESSVTVTSRSNITVLLYREREKTMDYDHVTMCICNVVSLCSTFHVLNKSGSSVF
jgi:hypothetical protein